MASFAALSSSRNARLSKSVISSSGTQKQQPAPQEIEPVLLPSTLPPPPPSTVVEAKPATSVPSSTVSSSPNPSAGLHGSLPDEVEIRSSSDRGRGVWTKKRKLTPTPPQLDEDGAVVVQSSTRRPVYSAGSTILAIQPHSAALSTSSLSNCCSNCLLSPPEIALQRSRSTSSSSTVVDVKLSRCAACRVARFCSRECQTSSWPSHQAECKGFSSLRRSYIRAKGGKDKLSADELDGMAWVPGEAVRALGRLVMKRKKERDANGNGRDGVWWKEITSLQSHRASMPPISAAQQGMPSPYAQLAISLGVYLGHCFPSSPPSSSSSSPSVPEEIAPADMSCFGFSNVGEVLDLCAAFTTNTFTLSSPSLTPIGVSISPTVALFNHSCWPNAVVVFPHGGQGRSNDAKGMEVVAITDIYEGEEILTSYIDISLPRTLRQADLLKRYFFTCDCALCSKSTTEPGWVDPREARLPSSGGEGLEVWVKEGMKLLKMEEDGHLNSLEIFLAHTPSLSILIALTQHLPPSSYPLLPLLRLFSTLLISGFSSTPPTDPSSSSLLNDALQITYLTSQAVLTPGIYPPGHPARGVALAELGKLLVVPAPEVAASSKGKSVVPKELFARGGGAGIPDEPARRLMWAREILVQALGEVRIGFGKKGDGGGLVGVELAGLVEGVGREIGLMRSSSGRGIEQ
ncbi:hypothetical protein BDY24DRAFT_214933 [Mrakia frigida]|uniref:uncharacterized protein n=1 Tax=Mrakia frigida TaxID=29902 RepID=UPI003FCC0DE9